MKKVLIITYYWPPAGGAGVQRWLKFSKYLPEFGYEPIIYAPSNPSYPVIDKSLENEVAEGLRVIKRPIVEPYGLAGIFSQKETKTISSGIIAEESRQSALQKLMLYIRGNFFIPDARKLWISPSVRFLTRFLQEENIDIVITTGPPHSMHLIGLGLKQKLNIKWIADFRDPWTRMWYFDKLKLSSASIAKHKKLEYSVVCAADHILVTTPTVRKEFLEMTKKPVHLITNGYDSDLLPNPDLLDKKFTLSHIGSIFDGEKLGSLWISLSQLIEESVEFRDNFQLNLVGKNNPELLNVLKTYGLGGHVKEFGYVPYSTVVKLQHQSQLLFLQYTTEKIPGIIPGKLFEYLNSRRPILAIGPENWDACAIINETNSGICTTFSEQEKLKAWLWDSFLAYRNGNLENTSSGVQKYHSRSLTERIVRLVNQ